MTKTQKELAFLRDLYIAPDWTQRFTDLFDRNFKFGVEKEILYVNGGSGNHVLEIREKLEIDSRINAYGEDEESNVLARGKAEMVGTEIIFTDEFPRESYDLVIADASLVRPSELPQFIEDIVDLSDHRVALFLPTSGSFGQIFSFLWEGLVNAGLLENAVEVERLISAIPEITKIEDSLNKLGLSKLNIVTEKEVFEFDNGNAFIESPLVADFLMPAWLDFLDEHEIESVSKQLVQLIDNNAEDLTFRFSVKATMIAGQKT